MSEVRKIIKKNPHKFPDQTTKQTNQSFSVIYDVSAGISTDEELTSAGQTQTDGSGTLHPTLWRHKAAFSKHSFK